ncbi:MAG TPA: hypothetical protein VM884_02210 [Flavisolibacter sp.]|jgi:hypothetical protein|nr:hypothetical protein [Flavisolibacter sp.]
MKRRFLSFCGAAALAISFTACSNTGTSSENADTSSTTTASAGSANTTPTTSTTSEGGYAAMADSVERNSQQGYYLNPKTGKAYKSLKVDRTTGSITDDAGEPVWRYVDNRNWWVYGGDNWSQVGEAQMEGERLRYKGDGDKWVDYDTRWKTDDVELDKKWKESTNGMKMKTEADGDVKMKDEDTKIKVESDGQIKIKDKKTGEKTKIDENGKVKQD